MNKKTYRVYHTGGIINNYIGVKAPNKTYARKIAQGELRPGTKITKIEEVK